MEEALLRAETGNIVFAYGVPKSSRFRTRRLRLDRDWERRARLGSWIVALRERRRIAVFAAALRRRLASSF